MIEGSKVKLLLSNNAAMALLNISILLLVCTLHQTNGYVKLPVTQRTKTHQEHLRHLRSEVYSLNLARGISPPSLHDSQPYVVTAGNTSTHFYINISMGSPHQHFTVLMRSDTTGVWLPSSLCPTDVYDMCRNHRQYNRSESSTYIRDGTMFGNHGMYCVLSSDAISLGGTRVLDQTFAEAIQYQYNDSGIPYDGLFGLGLRQKTFLNSKSLFVSMVEQLIVTEKVFGVYFQKKSNDPSDSGGLIIGGRNESLYHGNLTYVNCTNQYVWEVVMDRVILLDTPDMPPLCSYGCKASPAVGTHFISASKVDLDVLHQHLGASSFEIDLTYLFNCSALDKIPSVYISLGETLFKLPWQSFVDIIVGPTGNVICISSFVAYDSDKPGDWSFGDAFFTSLYVEFDIDGNRMGFAQSIYSA